MLSNERTAVEAYRLLIADVYELAGLSRRTSDEMAREVGQTAARWHVLSALSGSPGTASQLARRLGLRRQGVQRVIDGLRASGEVRVDPNPSDRRAPLVTLTPAGHAVCDRLFERSLALREAQLAGSGVDVTELDAARTTLRQLIDSLSE